MKIPYESKIVAYLDVLGFTDIVLGSQEEKLDSYFDCLPKLESISKKHRLEFYNVSDAIILIAPDNKIELENLIMCIRKLQSDLFSKNILLRGGISVGNLHFDRVKNIIVGSSYIHAYKLEGIANFPRVVIDRKIIEHYQYNNTASFLELSSKSPNPFVAIDADNFIYIDYLMEWITKGDTIKPENMNKVYCFIQEAFYKNTHLDKYAWLKAKIISVIEKKMLIDCTIIPQSKGTRNTRNHFIKDLPTWIDKFKRI